MSCNWFLFSDACNTIGIWVSKVYQAAPFFKKYYGKQKGSFSF